ncbi:MAG: hypothetical protein NT038_05265 [Euryarchaeota archaeon]|nr:hypothetical protein [Euryarchaeota archaeon]
MNQNGNLGITTAILLIGFILIAAIASSVIVGNSTNGDENSLKQITDEAVSEISTYIQVKDIMGKYYNVDGYQSIKKIVVLIKPLVSCTIDVTQLMVKLCNGQDIRVLSYSGQSDFISTNSLFEHPLWETFTTDQFGFIATLDTDRSLVDYNTINANTDAAYLILKLPEGFTLRNGDILTITLFPSTGMTRILTVEAPLPINSIVTLYP